MSMTSSLTAQEALLKSVVHIMQDLNPSRYLSGRQPLRFIWRILNNWGSQWRVSVYVIRPLDWTSFSCSRCWFMTTC